MTEIAQLGGYLNRKCDGPPGFECLWKGYVLFAARVQIMELHHMSVAKSRQPKRHRKSKG